MAKIRGFKPDLWTDEDFVEVSFAARLLWMGMWSYSCDNGHLPDRSKQIKMRVLPTDDVNCAELLRELEGQGLIERSEGWITVPNLTRHQNPDKRWFQTCDKTGCEKPSGNPKPETHSGPDEPPSAPARPRDELNEVELKGGEGKTPRRSASKPLPDDWTPTDTHRTYAAKHRVDVDREAFKFRNHAAANDRRQANWNAAFTTWLAKASEWAAPIKADKSHLPEAWR
jgi:hypothetical protein